MKQVTQTADQQVQEINEAVVKPSSSEQATPPQPVENPSSTPPISKTE
jgi:hypothetical protein